MPLIEFYGRECGHCLAMAPLVERLKKEEKISIQQLETWHDEANEKKRLKCDTGLCGGVPFFYNTITKKILCGESTYKELLAWAKGKT